jgi:hypothetical protein
MRDLVKEAPVKSIARTNRIEIVFQVGCDVEKLESGKVDMCIIYPR